MRPAVVFLPDTALLVPGAAGRDDPAAALREQAIELLRAAAVLPDTPGVAAPVLVVAPARTSRTLRHPVATGLGAAGLPPGPGEREPVPGAARADVPASVALTLLRAAGVAAPVDVVEVARDAAGDLEHAADAAVAAVAATVAAGVALLVVVGSPSARHGDDAPLAADPRAADADAALLAGLAGGPGALAGALTALGPSVARELAVSGWPTWRSAVAAVTGPVHVSGPFVETVAGAQHVAAAWHPAPREVP